MKYTGKLSGACAPLFVLGRGAPLPPTLYLVSPTVDTSLLAARPSACSSGALLIVRADCDLMRPCCCSPADASVRGGGYRSPPRRSTGEGRPGTRGCCAATAKLRSKLAPRSTPTMTGGWPVNGSACSSAWPGLPKHRSRISRTAWLDSIHLQHPRRASFTLPLLSAAFRTQPHRGGPSRVARAPVAGARQSLHRLDHRHDAGLEGFGQAGQGGHAGGVGRPRVYRNLLSVRRR
jgi:hypothetical protein